jgi:hypothetical protein
MDIEYKRPCYLTKTAAALGLEYNYNRLCYPSDPSDFNRCLELLIAAPEVEDAMPEIAKISKQWDAIISRWDEVETSFINEAGQNWSKGKSAPLTYELMKEIYSEA